MASFIPPTLVSLVSPLPLPNTAAPPGRGTATQGETPFSRQLEQSRQTRSQESARPAPPDKRSPAAAPPAAQSAQRSPRPEAAARNTTPRTTQAPSKHDGEAAAATDSASPNAELDAETEAEVKAGTQVDTAADPALQDLLAHMGPPPDPTAAAVDASLAVPPAVATPPAEAPQTATSCATAELAPASLDATGRVGTAAANLNPAVANDPGTAGTTGTATKPTDAREPAVVTAAEAGTWQQAQAAAVLADGTKPSRDLHDLRGAEPAGVDRTLAAPALAGLGSPIAHAGRAGDVVAANLATPATSAEFRAALGTQVSYFARAGIQQAELHLNPADMGPVSIQIVLDGQQAQVNFGADSALTRQIIESGMPELAGALRDAGLTLTGGGVSQHAGGQRQDANGNAAPGGSASNGPSGTGLDGIADPQIEQTRRSAVRSALGGVDLYA